MAEKADKMIAVSVEDADKIAQIQSIAEYPVTIKAVVHKAIADLYEKVVPPVTV